MDKNDLKSMWREAHYANSDNDFSELSTENTLSLKHCKVISKSIMDVKLKIILYTLILLLYISD